MLGGRVEAGTGDRSWHYHSVVLFCCNVYYWQVPLLFWVSFCSPVTWNIRNHIWLEINYGSLSHIVGTRYIKNYYFHNPPLKGFVNFPLPAYFSNLEVKTLFFQLWMKRGISGVLTIQEKGCCWKTVKNVQGYTLFFFLRMVDGKLTKTKSSLNLNSSNPTPRVDSLSSLNILGKDPGLEAPFPGGLLEPRNAGL